jgi:hypothetical protein
VSGISFMSDWSIDFQPAIDEPSNMKPFLEEVLVDEVGDHRHMLQLAARVGEADVDVFDLLVP